MKGRIRIFQDSVLRKTENIEVENCINHSYSIWDINITYFQFLGTFSRLRFFFSLTKSKTSCWKYRLSMDISCSYYLRGWERYNFLNNVIRISVKLLLLCISLGQASRFAYCLSQFLDGNYNLDYSAIKTLPTSYFCNLFCFPEWKKVVW